MAKRFGIWLGLALLVILAPSVQAQARRAVPLTPATATAKEEVKIRKVEGLALTGRVKTPEYVLNPTERSVQARDWSRILVRFETASEWIDELEFRYYVQVFNSKTSQDLLFTGTFHYVDVPKSKKHISTVFLRPETVARHGNVLGIAVEIFSNGELVATASTPETPAGWWRTTTVKTVPGVLLERSATPFAFVAYDDYLTAKPR